jgi:hypothetical protein
MSKANSRLLFIKSLHTLVWVAMVCVIAFVLWSGLTNNISIYSWLAVAIVFIEGLILLIFKGHCPLTDIARKYSSSTKHNFDIFLPEWLAKYNKLIFTLLFSLGLFFMIQKSLH